MDPDYSAKFAIHEAAREGNGKFSFRSHLPCKLTHVLVSVVESLLNVSKLAPLPRLYHMRKVINLLPMQNWTKKYSICAC